MQIKLGSLFKWFPQLEGILICDDANEFDELFEKHLQVCIERMEAAANHFYPDSEEKLSQILAASLSHPGLNVLLEAYTNGHVDLTIRQESIYGGQVRLAEAKIYKGPDYHTKALEQLIKRYSTGRSPTGYVIEYVKKANIVKLVKGLRTDADSHLPVDQRGKTKDHSIKWAYQSKHEHSSGEILRIVHLNVNLYRPQKQQNPLKSPANSPRS